MWTSHVSATTATWMLIFTFHCMSKIALTWNPQSICAHTPAISYETYDDCVLRDAHELNGDKLKEQMDSTFLWIAFCTFLCFHLCSAWMTTNAMHTIYCKWYDLLTEKTSRLHYLCIFFCTFICIPFHSMHCKCRKKNDSEICCRKHITNWVMLWV